MKIGIIGLGLIGGSIAKRLLINHEVYGYDEDPVAQSSAEAEGILRMNDAPKDLIIVSIPSERSGEIIENLLKTENPIIIDTNSFMTEYSDTRVFATHPMAGKETSGWESSDPHLFEEAVWAVTQENETVDSIIKELGTQPVLVSVEDHDEAVGRYSHLTQLLASAVAANDFMRAPEESKLSGPAYRDLTRVAASDKRMWESVFRHNRDNILPPLDELIQELQELKERLESDDYEYVNYLMDTGNKGRENLIKNRWTK